MNLDEAVKGLAEALGSLPAPWDYQSDPREVRRNSYSDSEGAPMNLDETLKVSEAEEGRAEVK